jgi:Methyltransferase domain
MDLKEQEILRGQGDSHWYYVSKGRALCSLIAGMHVAEILDVGAGSGVFARQMLAKGISARAVCVDPNYVEDWDEQYLGKPIQFRRALELVTQHLILMIDVLEHVDDDLGLIRSYTDEAMPGTLLLISVPAFEFLWSGHDIFLDHKRRYTLAQVESLVRQAGLEVVRGRYFFASVLPLAALMRLYDRLRVAGGGTPKSSLTQHSRFVNDWLTRVHHLEQVALFQINRVAGLSVFCLARKP